MNKAIKSDFTSIAMDTAMLDTAPCEFCITEYIYIETGKLAHLKRNQSLSAAFNKIIMEASEKTTKKVVRFQCYYNDDKSHTICAKHLKEMLEALNNDTMEAQDD